MQMHCPALKPGDKKVAEQKRSAANVLRSVSGMKDAAIGLQIR